MKNALQTLSLGGRPSANWLALLALVVIGIGFPYFSLNAFYLTVANQILINAAVAVSLSLLLGTTGQLSLGHAAFFTLGGYLSALAVKHSGLGVWFGIPVAVVCAGAVGWCVARIFLRLHGYYLAVATLGIGLVVAIILRNEKEWTGGIDGMTVEPLTVFGTPVYSETTWYYILLATLVAVIAATVSLLRSPAGRALRSLHDAEVTARTFGVDTIGLKVKVFVYSTALAALMGALFGHYTGFMTPSSASFMRSVEFVMMVVIGGTGSIPGAVVGAGIITLLPVVLADFEEYETLIVGFILLLSLLFMPKGLYPFGVQLWRGRRFGKGAAR